MAFNRNRKLAAHINVHMSNYPYECTICGRKYPSEKSLNYHMIKHGDPMFKCERCDKHFFYNDKLNKHKQTCNRQFVCHCGRTFVKKRWFDRHLMAHDINTFVKEGKIIDVIVKRKKYIFVCKYCKKRMSSRKILVAHEKNHITA